MIVVVDCLIHKVAMFDDGKTRERHPENWEPTVSNDEAARADESALPQKQVTVAS